MGFVSTLLPPPGQVALLRNSRPRDLGLTSETVRPRLSANWLNDDTANGVTRIDELKIVFGFKPHLAKSRLFVGDIRTNASPTIPPPKRG